MPNRILDSGGESVALECGRGSCCRWTRSNGKVFLMAENIRTFLALSELPRVGRARLKQILKRLAWNDDAASSLSDVIARLQMAEFSRSDLASALARADVLLDKCQSLGVTVHPSGSPSYPTQLERLSNRQHCYSRRGNSSQTASRGSPLSALESRVIGGWARRRRVRGK